MMASLSPIRNYRIVQFHGTTTICITQFLKEALDSNVLESYVKCHPISCYKNLKFNGMFYGGVGNGTGMVQLQSWYWRQWEMELLQWRCRKGWYKGDTCSQITGDGLVGVGWLMVLVLLLELVVCCLFRQVYGRVMGMVVSKNKWMRWWCLDVFI